MSYPYEGDLEAVLVAVAVPRIVDQVVSDVLAGLIGVNPSVPEIASLREDLRLGLS